MPSNRRQFLTTAVASGIGALSFSSVASAIDPIRRNGRPLLRLSLAAYSYRSFLTLNRNPTMTLADFIDDAARIPELDAVELTSYYFPRTTPEYLAGLKGQCTRLGLDISGTAVRNDFCTGNAEQMRRDKQHVREWIEHTSRLGGKTIRIFAGNIPRGDTEERARARCIEAIQEVCDHANQYGVFVALENHGGITASADSLLAIVQGVRHQWFGVNLDTGNFHTEDPYADLARLAPYAVNVQVKTEIQRAGQRKQPADLGRLINMLKQVNYRGYVVLEHEANEEPRQFVPRHLRRLQELINA